MQYSTISISQDISPSLLSALSLYDRSLRLDHFLGWPPGRFTTQTLFFDAAQRTHEWCMKAGAQILYPGHPLYPSAFLELEKPPLFLSCLGSVAAALSDLPRLAIVGSREPNDRVLEWMEVYLPAFLKRRRAVIVSGGARGVDQKAHAISIRSQNPTLVFLPSGLHRIFPDEMRGWQEAIFESGGALLSQYAPTQEIRRHHFEGRNRLIAALSQIVLVAEAKRKSGSVMTARLANELGRTLAVLPSFPGEPRSAGTLDLLFNGAFPLRDSEDLLTLFDGSIALNKPELFRESWLSTPGATEAKACSN